MEGTVIGASGIERATATFGRILRGHWFTVSKPVFKRPSQKYFRCGFLISVQVQRPTALCHRERLPIRHWVLTHFFPSCSTCAVMSSRNPRSVSISSFELLEI